MRSTHAANSGVQHTRMSVHSLDPVYKDLLRVFPSTSFRHGDGMKVSLRQLSKATSNTEHSTANPKPSGFDCSSLP